MRVRETSMTQKGQVTIPAEIRSRLGLKPRDKVMFELQNDVVTMRPVPSKVLKGYGAAAAKHLRRQGLREEFEKGVADEVVAETD